jgi:hypothetical protein
MNIDFNYTFKKLDGKIEKELTVEEDKEGNPKRDSDGKALLKLGKPFTLRGACLNVLTNPPLDIDPRTNRERPVSAEDKLIWADLAQRIFKCNGLLDVSADEVVLLKKFINKRYRNPLTVKQAYDILDPHGEKTNPLPGPSEK